MNRKKVALWISVGVFATLFVFVTVVAFVVASNLKVNVTLKPKSKEGKKIVIFSSKNEEEEDDEDNSAPLDSNFEPPNIAGRYEMVHRRYGRYLGVFKVPDIDEELVIQQDGKKLSGTLTTIRLRGVKPGEGPKKFATQTFEGSFIAPNKIQFKTPPAINPPLRWQVYTGKLTNSERGTITFSGKVEIHQPDEKKLDAGGKPTITPGKVGEWDAKQIADGRPSAASN